MILYVIGADDTPRVDIAFAGTCPACAGRIAIVRDFMGGTRDTCDCGFSRPTPRVHAAPALPKEKSDRYQYWRDRYELKKQRRRGAA